MRCNRVSGDGFVIGKREEVVGVGDSYVIGMAVTKEKLNTNNGGEGSVEIGIRLSDQGAFTSSEPAFFYFWVDFLEH